MQQTDIKSRSYVKVMVHCTRFKKQRIGGDVMREIKNLDALELSESLLDTYKCVHGFGFNGHFISLMPTKHYYYLAYKHRDSLDEHRLFKFVKVKESYEEDEIYNVLLEIRKEYGHDHENSEYDEDYKEVIDYLINSRDNTM